MYTTLCLKFFFRLSRETTTVFIMFQFRCRQFLFEVSKEDTRTTVIDVILVLSLLALNSYFIWIILSSIVQARRNRVGGSWGGGGCSPPPQVFANFYFDELKKIMLKWKTVQNYKTSRNFWKFIDFITLLSTSTPDMVSCQ